ncbi:MAG: hypothetical protein M1830_002681 [Pleopsidium flavum]|nr:MAG: hypothetical protein M1830_002681 [Pleopsidium flavum]
MPHTTLKERRSHIVETNQRPLAIDATKIVSGEIPLRSPLSTLTSRKYLEQLMADSEHQETLSIKGNEPQSRSRTPSRARSKKRSERSEEGESIAFRDKGADRDQQEDRHRQRCNEQGRSRTDRERFWDGLRAQLRIDSDSEDDIANSEGNKTQRKEYNPETHFFLRATPSSSRKWKVENPFQPSTKAGPRKEG